MKKYSMSSKQIIRWIFINYGLFILAFFSLGFMSNIKSVVVINFVLDVILCAVSVILNIKLFSTKYKTPIVGKIGLLSATLCFGLFCRQYDEATTYRDGKWVMFEPTDTYEFDDYMKLLAIKRKPNRK